MPALGGSSSSTSSTSSTGARSSSANNTGGATAQGAGPSARGASSAATQGPVYMPAPLGTPCHKVQLGAPPAQMALANKLAEAQEALESWRAQREDLDLSPFQSALKSITKEANRDGASPADLARADANATTLLEQIRKQRPIVLPNGWGEMSPQILPGYENMGMWQRLQAEKALLDKLERGRQLMEMVNSPNFDPQSGNGPTRKDISDIMFYLRHQSEQVGQKQPWFRGALTIPDERGKLRKWLDRTYGHVYTRDSSHLSKADQDKRGGQARGIDMEQSGSLDQRLPYGMRTILFQQFKRDGQTYLYLKLESEGARVNPIHRGRYGAGKDGPEKAAIRPVTWPDVPEAIRHLKNLLIPEKDHSGLSRHGEKFSDLPRPIRQSYQDLLDIARSQPHNAELERVLSQGATSWGQRWHGLGPTVDKDQLTGMQVSDMSNNLTEVAALLARDDNALSAQQKEAVQRAIDRWNSSAEEAWGAGYEGDLSHRVGDEVILHRSDLTRY